MGLVGYSDSEGSDTESPSKPPTTTIPTPRTIKPGFQKVVDTSGTRKIKVDLPTPAALEPTNDNERPAKNPRTSGLGGFNSFLPTPKRTAEQKKPGLGAGVNLRTGAEPAFSRERVEPQIPDPTGLSDVAQDVGSSGLPAPTEEKIHEVKIVGNAMRFKPLSVANKKPKKIPALPAQPHSSPAITTTTSALPAPVAPPPTKKKVSLFSISQQPDPPSDALLPPPDYKPLLADPLPSLSTIPPTTSSAPHHSPPQTENENTLSTLAKTLNLPPSARRQLLGRNSSSSSTSLPNIIHFDTDAEYNANERLRREGQAQEHRAVKAVAPGKHSLQQLVNAASTQREALEDKWAEGKRRKEEGGSRYGW